MRPHVDRRAVGAHVGDRGARSDRRVRDRREDISAVDGLRGLPQLRLYAGVVAHDDVRARAFDRHRVPLHKHGAGCRARVLFTLGNDPDDVA